MYHHKVEYMDLYDLVCHGLGHVLHHKQSVETTGKGSVANHGDSWKAEVNKLGCNPDEKCKPAKFLNDTEIYETLPKRETTGKIARVKEGDKPFRFEGDMYPKWKAVCPKGCVFGVKKWGKKTTVPKCIEHSAMCKMYERKGRSSNYKDEPWTPTLEFGSVEPKASKIITKTGENPDGELLVQDEETGEFRLAREVAAEMVCLPIDA